MTGRGEGVHQKQLPIVLIVESDVLLRLVTASNLRELGFEVCEAADAGEAVTVLNTIAVDAVLSDTGLPGRMDGFALARWVRERQLDTRIILSSTASQSLGEAAEYAALLAKPYSDTEVQELLKRMLLH
jgi:CheY-like chemotaxis protein